MMTFISALFLLVVQGNPQALSDPYLYWVELQGFQLHTSGDPSGSGEVSIMMALSPGKMACMHKGSSEYLSAYSTRTYKISGERFYIPKSWIADGKVDLVFFIRERDHPFPDDIIIPPRSVRVPLDDKLFERSRGKHSVVLEQSTFKTEESFKTTETKFDFLFIRKRASDCLFKGNDPNHFFKKENERIIYTQELRALGTRQLIGGIEWRQLKLTESADTSIQELEITQKANLRSCLRYKSWLQDFQGHHSYSDLLILYRNKMDELLKTTFDRGAEKEKPVAVLPLDAREKLKVSL